MASTKKSSAKQKNEEQNQAPEGVEKSVAEAPFFYADSLLSLTLGPYVSKATFGQQIVGTQPPNFNATVTIVMPTNAMFDMANHINKTFSQPKLADRLTSDHAKLTKSLKQ